jgi:hypothetical protein
MIGAAMGGLLVHPAHNLHYVEGIPFWAGVMPMALVGIACAFEVDFTPYLSAYGAKVCNDMMTASIVKRPGPVLGSDMGTSSRRKRTNSPSPRRTPDHRNTPLAEATRHPCNAVTEPLWAQ